MVPTSIVSPVVAAAGTARRAAGPAAPARAAPASLRSWRRVALGFLLEPPVVPPSSASSRSCCSATSAFSWLSSDGLTSSSVMAKFVLLSLYLSSRRDLAAEAGQKALDACAQGGGLGLRIRAHGLPWPHFPQVLGNRKVG